MSTVINRFNIREKYLSEERNGIELPVHRSALSSPVGAREMKRDVELVDVAATGNVVATLGVDPDHTKNQALYRSLPSCGIHWSTRPEEFDPSASCPLPTNKVRRKKDYAGDDANENLYEDKSRYPTFLFGVSSDKVDVKEHNKLRICYDALERELAITKRREKEQAKLILNLEEARSQIQNKVKFYEIDAQRAQEQSFKNMSEARWIPRDDRTLANEFSGLQKLIRDWAKQYAKRLLNLDSMNSSTDQELLIYLSEFVRTAVDGTLPAELKARESSMSDKFPHMLLSAALAYEIQTQYFQRPFFCLDNGPRKNEDTALKTLNTVYDQLVDANTYDGHSWRAQMLRILNPPQTSFTDRESTVSSDTCRRNWTRCEILATQFREGPAGFLMEHPEDEESRNEKQKELRGIFMRATELATTLWTQKSYLQCLGLPQLMGPGFHSRSSYMEAHRLHKLEDDDSRLDGHAINIVVHPAIFAIGTHEGEDYDSRPRILAKAVVWVEA